MAVTFQDPARDRREQARQGSFGGSSWRTRPLVSRRHASRLHAARHRCRGVDLPRHIHGATWDWLLVAPIALLGNWVEWAAHRYILHRPVKGLEMIYKRHCGVHHQFLHITICATAETRNGAPCSFRRSRPSPSSSRRCRRPW